MGQAETSQPLWASAASFEERPLPLDEEDHALRYLIATIDQGKLRRKARATGPAETNKPKERKWLSLYNEALWTRFWTISRQ